MSDTDDRRRNLWARTVDDDQRHGTWVQPYMPPDFHAWNDWLDATARLLKSHHIHHVTVSYTDEWSAGERFSGHEYHRFETDPREGSR